MPGTRSCQSLIGKQLVPFARDSSQGPFNVSESLGHRPLILVFLPDLGSPACHGYVRALEANRGEFEELDGVIVVVTAAPKAAAHADLAFPVAADAHDLFAEYGLVEEREKLRSGVIIADRYGTVSSVYCETTCSELPDEVRVARALLGAESSCPECGVPEQHWLEAVE